MVLNSDYTVDYEKKTIRWVSSHFSEFTLKDVKGEILGKYKGGKINGKLLVIKYDANNKLIHQILLRMDIEGHWYNNEHIFQLFQGTTIERADPNKDFKPVTYLKF